MKKINVITLGCSKNTVDSEHLMARLAAAGYEVLFDSVAVEESGCGVINRNAMSREYGDPISA